MLIAPGDNNKEAFKERMFTNPNLTLLGGLVLGAIAAELKCGSSR